MAGYVAIHVDQQMDSPSALDDQNEEDIACKIIAGSSSFTIKEKDIESGGVEEVPLLHLHECRICQDEDTLNNLEAPCGCSGSLKYAHRKCVQHWCNEKKDTTCEICHQPYQPGYTAPQPPPPPEEFAIEITGAGFTINGAPLDLNDPRLMALSDLDRHFLEAEYEDIAAAEDSNATTFCRSATLILMALLLLRHAFTAGHTDGDDDDNLDMCTFLALFLLKVAAFLLPCYIMAWTISLMQCRKERQEAATGAARRFALVLQSGESPDLRLTIAPPHGVAPNQEPV